MHIVINIDPVLFSLGPLSIRWYGLMYVVGITIGLLVAWRYARSKGITTEQLERMVFWAIPAGFVGARLYYVLQQPLGQYLSQPWRIFAVWEGGMAFYGAIFAVVLTIIILSRKMRISVWKFLDTAVVFGAVGQFFGRIGNIINGDIIGYPTTLPWGVIYTNPNSFPPSHTTAYQPAAIYEAIIDIILIGLLWWLRDKVKPGILFFTYVFGYSLSQLIVFFWRDNQIILAGLKQAQITAIGVVVLAAISFVLYIRYQNRQFQTIGDGNNLKET
jgi:phosphatidylglycerol---prolipoprotein diacylglyceryl transferase